MEAMEAAADQQVLLLLLLLGLGVGPRPLAAPRAPGALGAFALATKQCRQEQREARDT